MSTTDPNTQTIQAYDTFTQDYIRNTPQAYQPHHAQMLHWIDQALAVLPAGGKVLEIGSATPRDATYIRSKGFEVQCSDATQGFVDNLRKNGENALKINLLTSSIKDSYDMIFANSVSSHFTEAQLISILHKVYATLKPGGVFAFNVKRGDGEAWVVEKIHGRRFTHYWQASAIAAEVTAQGFKVLFLDDTSPGDLTLHNWINIVAQKPHQK